MLKSEVQATTSVAAVKKSSGSKLRKIVQCVPLNNMLRPVDEIFPPDLANIGLTGGAALCRLSPVAPVTYGRGLDESNAFTMVECPPTWTPYMAGPALRQSQLPVRRKLPNQKGGTWVHMGYLRLAMGCSIAAHILQLINFHAVRMALACSRPIFNETGQIVRRLTTRVKMVILNETEQDRESGRVALEEGVVAIYVHIDDFGFFSSCQYLAAWARDRVRRHLMKLGFTSTTSDLGGDEKFVGYSLQEEPTRWQPTMKRLGHVQRAIEEVLDDPAPQTAYVHAILGIYVWMTLLRRELMSIPQNIYAYVTKYRGYRMQLWGSVRRELCAMRGALPLIYADLTRKPFGLVCAQDAAVSENAAGRTCGAYSLAVATPAPDELGATLQALRSAGRSEVLPASLGGAWSPRPGYDDVPLHGRTIVPRRWADGGMEWWIVLSRHFRWELRIAEGEARAALSWTRILARLAVAHCREILQITDNLCVASLYARGRSTVPNLNRIMRANAALTISMDSKVHAPWIDTHAQPADVGTRSESVAGPLFTGQLRWQHRRLFVQIGFSSSELQRLSDENGLKNIMVPRSQILVHDDRVLRSCRRTLLRRLETYEIGAVAIMMPDNQRDPGSSQGNYTACWDTIGLCIRVCKIMDTTIWVIGRPGNSGWGHAAVLDALAHCGADHHDIDLAHYDRHRAGIRHIAVCRSHLVQPQCRQYSRASIPAPPDANVRGQVRVRIPTDPLPRGLCSSMVAALAPVLRCRDGDRVA